MEKTLQTCISLNSFRIVTTEKWTNARKKRGNQLGSLMQKSHRQLNSSGTKRHSQLAKEGGNNTSNGRQKNNYRKYQYLFLINLKCNIRARTSWKRSLRFYCCINVYHDDSFTGKPTHKPYLLGSYIYKVHMETTSIESLGVPSSFWQ